VPPTTVSRRWLLVVAAGAAAAAATGCAGTSAGPSEQAPAVAPGDLDRARRAAADAAELVAVVAGAERRHPELQPLLAGLGSRHRTHVEVFTPEGEVVAPPGPGRVSVPRSRRATLRVLRAREQRAAAAARRAAADAGGGELAAALASCAACLAQHVRLLSAALADTGTGRS